MLKRISFSFFLSLILTLPALAQESSDFWSDVSCDLKAAFAEDKGPYELQLKGSEYFLDGTMVGLGTSLSLTFGMGEQAQIRDIIIRGIPELQDDLKRLETVETKVVIIKEKASKVWREKASAVELERNAFILNRAKAFRELGVEFGTRSLGVQDHNEAQKGRGFINRAEDSRRVHLELQDAEEELKKAKNALREKTKKYLSSKSIRTRLKKMNGIYLIRLFKWAFAGVAVVNAGDLAMHGYCAMKDGVQSPISPTEEIVKIVLDNAFEEKTRKPVSQPSESTKKEH